MNRRFVFFSKLKEHFSVSNLRFKVFLAFDLLFEAAAILQQLLRGFLIAPEIRRRGLTFDLVQLLATCRHIKETSRAVQLARAGCQTKLLTPESLKCPS